LNALSAILGVLYVSAEQISLLGLYRKDAEKAEDAQRMN
jgi:hypothetical protein